MARKLARKRGPDSDGATDDEEPDAENIDADASAGSLLNRRDYVKLSAAATGAVLASSGLGSAAEERYGIPFDRVVNAVDDLGMDPTGSEPIDSALSAAWETGTLIEFPEGDYYVSDTRVVVDDSDRVGMRGLGDDHTDVRFFFPDFDENEFFIINHGGSGVIFENFSIDCGPDEDTIAAISTRGDDDIWAVDLEWLGFYSRQESTPGALLWIQANDVDGVATARRITMGKHGSALGGHSSSTGTSPGHSYIRNETGHVGEFRLEDSHLEQCGHNTMRSSNNDGVVTVKNCFIKNADISGLRFNGGDHPEKTSLIENCHFLVDHRELNDTGGTAPHHAMGGVFPDSRVGNAGLVVRNCDFEWKHILQETIDNDGSLWGMIRVPSSGHSNPGGITIENCRLYNDTIVPPIWINEISTNNEGELPNQPWEVTLDDVNITMNEGETSQDDWNILIQDGRDESVVKNSCIYSPGGSMDGIVFENSDGVVVEDSNINVTGEAVELTNTDGNIRNISHDDSCPLPTQHDSDDDEDGDDSSGGDDDSSDDDDDQTTDEWTSFVIDGFDSDTRGEYEFIVEGDARENTELSEYGTVNTIETTDDGRTRVAGAMRSGTDAFDYAGYIVSYAADADMVFERDGEEISRDEIVDYEEDGDEDDDGEGDGDDSDDSSDGDDDSSDDDGDQTTDEWTSFVINGFDSDTRGEYEFIVEGDARENTELSRYGTVNTIETTDDGDTRVAGAMRSGADAFDYAGYIVSYAADDDMVFERDGEEISRDEVVDYEFEDLDHTLQIMGTGSTSSFNFTVDGELVADPSCEISCADSISGSSAEDAVTSETAMFQFDGNISDFSLDGDAGVYLDGDQVDPELLGIEDDPFLTNWLIVDGLEDETTYQFSVTGNLYKSPDLGPVEADDVISDGMVIGSVNDGVDGYRFNGDLTMLRVQGTADVQFDEQ
ncbi:hypothetical protein RH858_16080 [Halalkaliarchaeum sp. AArc-GB]|uniref:hypothetical protein n=1 Tax=Halalkaliarchaeum sp. AArc-GB TaxID=3074078 RepID=UPI002861EC3F|nr:hypothetical protein [Halalkaliarchaeum sp. AArc-GB]MDR5674644.1 hypothetical protein [Halalkaliarchaeum sp. AArc-GB]